MHRYININELSESKLSDNEIDVIFSITQCC